MSYKNAKYSVFLSTWLPFTSTGGGGNGGIYAAAGAGGGPVGEDGSDQGGTGGSTNAGGFYRNDPADIERTGQKVCCPMIAGCAAPASLCESLPYVYTCLSPGVHVHIPGCCIVATACVPA